MKKAWQILSSSKKWVRGHFAKDKDGMSVDPSDRTAVCFCAAGALMRAYGEGSNKYESAAMRLRDHIVTNTIWAGIPSWNDHQEQRWDRVRAVLKRLDI